MSIDCTHKILQEVNVQENAPAMSNEKCRTLDDIDDILIIRKIAEKDPTTVIADEILEAKECLCFTTECDCEKFLLVEEQEAIIKRQLQMLQADERGKQALISEIAAIKQIQEQKAELLRNRQRARDIERERARKIASLPPPLPKSVKSLLKKSDDEPETDKPNVQMPDELKAVSIKPVEPSNENKENILDPKELEAKQKIQEGWQMKAKKRFIEALKKDRQKEEYSNIMKQIQNAELQNRREMAKNISSDKEGMPCPFSDKIQFAKKQADMEEATEKLFKKMSNKEHVIEDIEGYQDHYEDKYKRIDSNYESKVIDCIPDFVKENYEYLLEDESKFQGGKNFSELDDSSSDVFNQAYIETPPDIDELDGREKIDIAVRHLDKLRSDLQTEYEQTLKPLLVAAIEVPKKQLSDKAVETELVKLPAEDKAVETEMQYATELTSPSTLPIFDFKNSGVMAYKRRHHGPVLSSYREMSIPDMHKREVFYPVPSVTHSEVLATGSWSSSSYCSLPSKHGIPAFPSASENVKCDICVAEMKKDSFKEDVTHELSPGIAGLTKKSDKLTVSNEKAQLSEYVQKLAKKYLVTKSTLPSYTAKESTTDISNHSYFPTYSDSEDVSSAFEKEVICKSKAGLYVEHQKSKEFVPASEEESVLKEKKSQFLSSAVEKPDIVTRTEENVMISDSSEPSVETGEIHKDKIKQKHLKDDIYNEIKMYESSKSPVEYSDYDLEAKRIQAIRQVLSRRIPRFTLELSPKSTESKDLKDDKETEISTLSVPNRMSVKPHIYHELSTIQELDSAVTAGSLHLSQSKLSDTSEVKTEKKFPLDKSADRLKIVSLLDPPDSEISELAKSIHFVAEDQEKVVPLQILKSVSLEHLNSMVSSKDDLSLPSHISDSNSSSSVSSTAKVFSSTLCGNQTKRSHLRDIKILPKYFKDVSDIQPKISDSEKSVLCSSAPSSESIPSFPSPVSSSSQSIPSIIDRKPIEKEETVHSIVSGYISDLKTAEMTKSDISHPIQEKEETAYSIVSGYISNIETPNVNNSAIFYPMIPHSDVSSPDTVNIADKHDSNIDKNIKTGSSIKDSHLHYGHVLIQSSSPESNVHFKCMTPHSNILSSSKLSVTPRYEHPDFATSTESFKPLTPCSDISSPNELAAVMPRYQHPGFATSTESFKPLTPHSDVSSPSELAAFTSRYKHSGSATSTESFKPLIPCSFVSSPSELAAVTPRFEHSSFPASTESFKALTSHSNISSPSDFPTCAPDYGHQGFAKNSENFKTVTPHSNISSRETAVHALNFEQQCYVNSSQDFKALTPKSMVSFPSFPYNETELKRKIFSSKSSEFFPVTVRLDISTSSISSDNANNQIDEQKKLCHLNYNLALKTQLSKPLKYTLSPKVSGQRVIKTECNEKKMHHVNKPKDDIQIEENEFDKIKAKQNAYPCSSDFFVPHINNLPSLEVKNNEHNLVEDILITEYHENNSKSKSKIDLQMGVVSSSSSETQTKLLEMKSGVECVSSSEEILANSSKEKPMVGKSKDFFKKQNLQDSEMEKGLKICSNLQTMSSTSSSAENLSEISGSKVLYQSTPIKNLSQIIQEPGIMEEPDLTLVNTELSCKVGSPENPRGLSTSSPDKHCINEEKDNTITTSQNECEIPTFKNSQLLGCTDTPSMMSFLRHEISCMQTEVDEEVKRPQFQRSEYKLRTKRLWNNLEEVKKKNLEEERKRLMEINRLKAKEYAKKLTPKQKGK